ncbi:hypothetical protein ACWGJQ_13220 [Peribacillus simplex]
MEIASRLFIISFITVALVVMAIILFKKYFCNFGGFFLLTLVNPVFFQFSFQSFLAKLYFNSNSGMLVDGVDFSRRYFGCTEIVKLK